MSIKSVVSYSCIIFSIIILIISLATNYWHEYEIPDGKVCKFIYCLHNIKT